MLNDEEATRTVREQDHPAEKSLRWENIYDCWQQTPINQGFVLVYRQYPFPPDRVAAFVNEAHMECETMFPVQIKGFPEYKIPDRTFTGVSYLVDLADLNFPSNFKVSNLLNLSLIESNLAALSQMGTIAQGWIESGKYLVKRVLSEIEYLRPNLPVDYEFIPEMKSLFQEQDIYGEKADKLLISQPLTVVLGFIRKQLELIAENSGLGEQVTKRAEKLLTYHDFTPNRGTGIHPSAAYYHDSGWTDPSFPEPEEGGVYIGSIPQRGYHSGLDDYSAMVKMLERISNTNNLSCPPNLTNMVIYSIPVTPNGINDFEEKFIYPNQQHLATVNYRDPLRFVYCDLPSRLNPNVVSRSLDAQMGKNGWVLMTSDEKGKLVRLVTKPKGEWVITSEKRPITPLIIDSPIQIEDEEDEE